MNPATNPAPAKPTPLTDAWMLSTTDFVNTAIPQMRSLERALAEAKRENERLTQKVGDLKGAVIEALGGKRGEMSWADALHEVERLKADKERLRVALRDGIDKLETLVNVHDDGSAYVRAKLRMAELVGFGPAIDRMKEALYPAARTTQEGQG